jgi:hypothetical protein
LSKEVIVHTGMTLDFASLLVVGGSVDPREVMQFTLWITGILCLLNVTLANLYRARKRQEVISYYAACIFELAVFVFALLFYVGVITRSQIPYPLPPKLPVSRAEIAAALAIGLGLFPVALWHRINLAELPKRIAEDGKTMKQRPASVRVKSDNPENWVN